MRVEPPTSKGAGGDAPLAPVDYALTELVTVVPGNQGRTPLVGLPTAAQARSVNRVDARDGVTQRCLITATTGAPSLEAWSANFGEYRSPQGMLRVYRDGNLLHIEQPVGVALGRGGAPPAG
jgi:hypothetical protein